MKRIVVGTDLSDGALGAMDWALRWARLLPSRHPTSRWERISRLSGLEQTDSSRMESVEVIAAHSMENTTPALRKIAAGQTEREERQAREAKVRAWLEKLHQDTSQVRIELLSGNPVTQLPRLARRLDADWLIVGMTGQNKLTRMVVGSVPERIVHNPPCHTVVKHPSPFPWDGTAKIAVAIDLSDHSRKALELAAQTAHYLRGPLRIVHVIDMPRFSSSQEPDERAPLSPQAFEAINEGRQDVIDFLNRSQEALAGLDCRLEVIAGYPPRQIVEYTRRAGIDLLVLGTAGRTALGDFVVGSVATNVIKEMPCTVMLSSPHGE